MARKSGNESETELDKTMERLLKETADEMGIPTGIGKEAYLITMELGLKQVRKFKPWLLPNMGLFYLSPWKTARRIWTMFKSMRNRMNGTHPTGMTREEVCERLKIYKPLHEIATKHYPKTGKKYKREVYLKKLKEEENGVQG